MAAEGVRIRVDAEAALRDLGRMMARAEKPRGMFDAIGASLVTSTQMHFERGTGPDGSPWPPSLRALTEGGKTLIDSAILMQSITFVASDTGVEVGTNILYAAVHQFGATIQAKTDQGLRFKVGDQWVRKDSVTIPARPFLGLDDADSAEIVHIAEDWLAGEERGRPS
ncbi:MAG: phage virion morphogenesis protein [Rhizobiales bacterium]|nr:phage virion morphogenesis protein [Hyphomicrobiales bacterium]